MSFSQAPTSSHHAPSKLYPRMRSGVSLENKWQTPPLGHRTTPVAISYVGMLLGGHRRNNPSSIITLRPAKCVGAISAMERRRPVSISFLTHCAPVQLLPAPRPAHSSHNRHGGGGGA